VIGLSCLESFPESSSFDQIDDNDRTPQNPSVSSGDDEKYLYEENAEERTVSAFLPSLPFQVRT